MTANFTGHEPEISPLAPQTSVFAATPVWERRSRVRSLGARASKPQSGANVVTTPVASDPADPRISKARAAYATPLVTAALAVSLVAVVGVVGWQTLTSRDDVALVAPESTMSEVAGAPVTPAEPLELAANTLAPPPVAAPAQPVEPRAQRDTAPAPRVRPAAPVSTEEAAVDTSASLPDAPQPYTDLSPAPAAEPMPYTPPVLPAPSPSTVDLVPGDTAPPI